jgi:hypothetical protein
MSRLARWRVPLANWWSKFGLFVKIAFLVWLTVAMLGPTVYLLAEDKSEVAPLKLIGGVLIALLAFALAGARWAMVSRALGAPIPFSFALHFNFVGLFFYCVTPFGIGQDVLKVMKSVNAVSGVSTAMAISQVMLDRLIGLACLLLGFGAVAVLVFPDILISPILAHLGERPVAVSAVVAAALGGGAAAVWYGPGLIGRYVGRSIDIWQVIRMMFSVEIGAAALLSLASQFLHIGAILILLAAFGRSGDYWAIACASFGGMVFFFIPVSVFGVGAPQLAAAALMVALGASARDAAVVVLLSYATILIGGLVGGALEITREMRTRRYPPIANSDP